MGLKIKSEWNGKDDEVLDYAFEKDNAEVYILVSLL